MQVTVVSVPQPRPSLCDTSMLRPCRELNLANLTGQITLPHFTTGKEGMNPRYGNALGIVWRFGTTPSGCGADTGFWSG